MTFAEILVALGGSTMVLAGLKWIFTGGRLVEGQVRMEKKLDGHIKENTLANQEFRTDIADLVSRVGVLEYANGLTDRRHLVRRTQDQINRDVRDMGGL